MTRRTKPSSAVDWLADEAPVTWAGLIVWLAESSILLCSFSVEMFLFPCLLASRRFFTACASSVHPLLHIPSCAFHAAMAKFRQKSRPHQFLLAAPVVWHVVRRSVWFLNWLQSWPWWYVSPALLTLELVFSTIPDIIRTPSRYLYWFKTLSTQPVLLPQIRLWNMSVSTRTIPKIYLWRLYNQQEQLYRALKNSYRWRISAMLIISIVCRVSSRVDLQRLVTARREIFNSAYAFEDQLLVNSFDGSTPRFVPDICRGLVVSVYDGDTLTVAARHNRQGPVYRFSVRLHGIDTPEIRGVSASETAAALAARDMLRSLVLRKPVTLNVKGLDKYGRLLANVIHDEHGDMSNVLLESGYAVHYDGGKRGNWGDASGGRKSSWLRW